MLPLRPTLAALALVTLVLHAQMGACNCQLLVSATLCHGVSPQVGFEERLDAPERGGRNPVAPSSGGGFGMSMGKLKNRMELGYVLGNCGKSRPKLYLLVNRLRLNHYNLARHRGWLIDRRLTVKMRIALSHSSRLLHLCAERRSPRHQVSGFSLAHLDTPLHRRRGCLPSPFLVESLFLKSSHDCPSPSSPCFCHLHVDAPLVKFP